MKNLKVVMLTALTALGLASCGGGKTPAHEHIDANKDHICDSCGEKASVCIDETKDHLCDICGIEMSEHSDENHDGKCDYCGFEGIEVHHKDEDKDEKCDVCGCDIIDESWALDTSKVQLTFSKGDTFNSKNLKAVITRTDGTTKELSGSDLSITKPSMSTTGTKTVKVKFTVDHPESTEAGVDASGKVTLEYQIEVVYWTTQEANILNQVSYLADVNTTYPYVKGASVNVSETGDAWWIELPDATEEDLINYNSLLTSIKKSRVESNSRITYEVKGTELPAGGAELFGIEPDTAFACLLIPNLPYPSNPSYTVRYYNEDELIVGGLNDEGSMIVTNYFIDASLESYLSILNNGNYFDGEGGFYPSWLDGINDLFGSEFGTEDWYDRPSACGVLPELFISDTSEDAAVFPLNYKTMYPFNEYIQSYDVALELFLQMGSTADRTDFVDELVARGFVVGEPENIGSTTPIYSYPYTLSNKFYGDWEVSVSDVLKNGDTEVGYYVDILFRAPAEKFSELRTFTELTLLPMIGINAASATISETAIQQATNCLSGSVTGTGVGVEEYALGVLEIFEEAGWTIENSSETAGVYSATVTNGIYRAHLTVEALDGGLLITFEVSGYVPADLSELKIVTDIFQAKFETEELPVLDTDYTVDENGVYSLTYNTGVKATNVVAELTQAVQTTWFNTLDEYSALVPSYLNANGESGLYYRDSSRTTLNGQASFISGNKQYYVDLVVESVNGELVATFNVGTVMPKLATAEKAIQEITNYWASYGFVSPNSYVENADGSFSVTVQELYYNVSASGLSFDLLDECFYEMLEYGVPSYFVVSEIVHDETNGVAIGKLVSLDGTIGLDITLSFRLDSTDGTYFIDFTYTTYAIA